MAPRITAPAITTALIYTRVSSDEQARDGLSLDTQLATCRRYASGKGWTIGREFSDVLSGTRDDRPDYVALLAEARRLRAEGQPVAAVVARLDRFGRRVLERVRARDEFKKLGVTTHSVHEGGEVSDLVANILASVAQEEVERLGRRVSEVRAHVVTNGWAFPGPAAWGYRWRPATDQERAMGAPRSVLEIDPETAPYARRAWELAAETGSIRQVAAWAAALPEAARGGRTMPYHFAWALLHSPVYIGRAGADDGGATPVGRWPALVSDATWATVRARLDEHARVPHQASGKYLLTGIARCPECGGRMSAWRSRRQGPRYKCQAEPTGACSGSALMAALDEAVLAEVTPLLATVAGHDPALSSALRRAWARLQAPAADTGIRAREVKRLEALADKARQRMTRGTELFVDGELTREQYDALLKAAEADLKAAEAELSRLGERSAPAGPALPPLDTVVASLGGWAEALAAGDVAAQRDLLSALIEGVVPERIGWGRYEARITWTPVGAALVAATGARVAAA